MSACFIAPESYSRLCHREGDGGSDRPAVIPSSSRLQRRASSPTPLARSSFLLQIFPPAPSTQHWLTPTRPPPSSIQLRTTVAPAPTHAPPCSQHTTPQPDHPPTHFPQPAANARKPSA